ncbi:amidohydrolase family protein [Kaistia algarum]|uniref:amidohydrolase family protein n=1 Tax=Kaistia algarum TaxID=2083279 RepID=UPI002B1DC6CF|nr:amidohydrolase family protein [Kaistia algarum]
MDGDRVNRPQAIIDAHLHLFDDRANAYSVFEAPDATFEALVGDYSALPHRYAFEHYSADTDSRIVEGIVWHEFMSRDPAREVNWAQRLADSLPVPMSIVAMVDFLDPRLDERLDTYRTLPNVTAVRQHLAWDEVNPQRRMAARPDFLRDEAWRRGLGRLRDHDFRCGLEVFGPQMCDLVEVVHLYPDIEFTLALMGWPLDLGPAGFASWKENIRNLAQCPNVCASLSAIECIFGMDWTIETVRPWLLTAIEHFGPGRCMIGSHLPISRLSFGFTRLYDAYDTILAPFSDEERDQIFRTTARDWFRVGLSSSKRG